MDQARAVAGGGNAAYEGLLRAATVALEVPGAGGGASSLGTGFLVAPGIVATCAHVLADRREDLPARVSARFVVAGRDLECETVPEWYLRDTPAALDLAFLRCPGAADLGYALLSTALVTGDPLLTYGHPSGMFRAGQSATLRYEGPSRLHHEDGDWHPLRVAGTPVTGGYSGSPVLNQRSGAVCGMLVYSNERGSAHMVSATDIIAGSAQVRSAQVDAAATAGWLSILDDGQLRTGGWAYPGPRLRAFLETASRAARQHPYPGMVPGVEPPPLDAVYVAQRARPSKAGGDAPAAAILAQNGDCVLVGGPGVGKSSLLRYGLLDAARGWLEARSGNAVPVRVLAADLVAARPVPEAIAASVRAELDPVGSLTDFPAEFFAAEPCPGARWLVLVDGLDEVIDVERRRGLVRKLAALSEDPRSPYRFVLATRPLPDGELPEYRWPRFELLPLATTELAGFAEGWFTALALPDPAASAARFTEMTRRSSLASLARTPLLAAMLCQLFALRPERELPHGRAGAYRSFVDLLRERRFALDGGIHPQLERAFDRYGRSAVDAAGQLADQFDELLGRLASARQDGDLTPALDLLAGWAGGLRPAHVPEPIWRSSIADLLRRTGLMVQHGDDFTFFHQTVGEFLAAAYLAADRRRSAKLFRTIFHWRLYPDARAMEWASSWGGRASRWRRPRDMSFASFLVATWHDRPGLTEALLKVARRGGSEGGEFIAALVVDGVVTDRRVIDTAAETLLATSRRPGWWSVQYSAATAVGRMGDPRGGDRLAEIATNPRFAYVTRVNAARELWSLDDPRGVDLLRALGAAVELAWLRAPGSADLLAAQAENPGFADDTRIDAAWVLAKVGDPRGLDLLAQLAVDPALNAYRRAGAATNLADLADRRAIDLLAGLIEENDIASNYRRQWLEKLVHCDDPAAADRLAELSRSPAAGTDLHHPAAAALAHRGDARGLDRLAEIAAKPTVYYGAARDAAMLLHKLGDDRGHQQLLRTVNSKPGNSLATMNAATDLATIGDSCGVEHLVDLATRPSEPWVSGWAADQLAQLMAEARIDRSAADQLATIADDPRTSAARHRLALEALTLLDDRRGHRGPRRAALLFKTRRDPTRRRYPLARGTRPN
ncbi:trypsin-like peptidase domain-containing protein [Longispora sp. NPDC051575]|uniref:trypsin-like peptidase domain-containing protein n=1 Tax=Longispora sp. NPDC051575 TaxID=3154943 RepID=UPI00341EE8D5